MKLARAAVWMLCAAIGPVCASSASLSPLRAQDSAGLEAAAIAIAKEGNPAKLAVLATRLGDAAFLRSLDPPRGSEVPVVHVRNVFLALAQKPSAATADLCIALAHNANFTAVPARLNLLLNALAEVRPLSRAGADVFRTTDAGGFIEVNGPLLARNASPLALEVLSQILSDDRWEVAQRVSIAHWSLLPTRVDLGIVQMSAQMLQQEALSHDVRVAVLESLYDDQPVVWFGRNPAAPAAPAWSSASHATLVALQSLGQRMLDRSDLPGELRTAITNTLDAVSSISRS